MQHATRVDLSDLSINDLTALQKKREEIWRMRQDEIMEEILKIDEEKIRLEQLIMVYRATLNRMSSKGMSLNSMASAASMATASHGQFITASNIAENGWIPRRITRLLQRRERLLAELNIQNEITDMVWLGITREIIKRQQGGRTRRKRKTQRRKRTRSTSSSSP